jgi:hypothetical protein
MLTRKKKWLRAKICRPNYSKCSSSVNPNNIVTKKISFNELVQIKTIPSRETLIEYDLIGEIWYSSIDYYHMKKEFYNEFSIYNLTNS